MATEEMCLCDGTSISVIIDTPSGSSSGLSAAPDACDSGYLRDISEREIDLGFDSGIPPPADYELISPAGAPVELPPGDFYTNSTQHVQHFPQSISANNINAAEDPVNRRTSLQVSATLAKERRASLQLVISDAIHTKTSHSHHHRPWEPSADGKPMYDGPDLPSADLPEDHTGLEPSPVPLDASKISTHIQGYETTCHGSRGWT
ncbi:hypothetical protein NP493_516g00001 [Ridgeia piscesae]|uniref:Uncharacterized protein n=1 Tax=Ridgeia piscesae TaxID=27915 RepID=A0AAD9KXC4_RIDPI|nr:hypothetical protein NP493_516g00001 [Ridgeia piscesae]